VFADRGLQPRGDPTKEDSGGVAVLRPTKPTAGRMLGCHLRTGRTSPQVAIVIPARAGIATRSRRSLPSPVRRSAINYPRARGRARATGALDRAQARAMALRGRRVGASASSRRRDDRRTFDDSTSRNNAGINTHAAAPDREENWEPHVAVYLTVPFPLSSGRRQAHAAGRWFRSSTLLNP